MIDPLKDVDSFQCAPCVVMANGRAEVPKEADLTGTTFRFVPLGTAGPKQDFDSLAHADDDLAGTPEPTMS